MCRTLQSLSCRKVDPEISRFDPDSPSDKNSLESDSRIAGLNSRLYLEPSHPTKLHAASGSDTSSGIQVRWIDGPDEWRERGIVY
jgi:hypothetical protein